MVIRREGETMTEGNSDAKPENTKWILKRPDNRNAIRIVGNVYTTVSDDVFLDEFIDWLEGRGWSFFGRTVQLTDEDNDNEILEDILLYGIFDDKETE